MHRTAVLLALLLTACSAPADSAPAAGEPAPAAGKAEAPADKPEATPKAAGSYRDASIDKLEEVLPTLPLLLDVRTAREYEGGHVKGAKLIPVAELSGRLGEIEAHRGDEIWIICQSGGRSAKAGHILKAEGFRVVNVLGGTGAWKAAGKPVE